MSFVSQTRCCNDEDIKNMIDRQERKANRGRHRERDRDEGGRERGRRKRERQH